MLNLLRQCVSVQLTLLFQQAPILKHCLKSERMVGIQESWTFLANNLGEHLVLCFKRFWYFELIWMLEYAQD